MSDVGGLQLLPNQKKKINFSIFSGNNTFLSIAVILLLFVGVAYGLLRFYTNRTVASIGEIDRELGVIYQTRDKGLEERLINFDRQAEATRSLLKSHTVWVQGLKELQQQIEPRVKFNTLTADATKRILIFQAAADSYSVVAKQIASFYRSELMSDITLNNVGSENDGKVNFTMELKFKSDHFLQKNTP